MNCPKCNSSIADDSRFCNKCGHQFSQQLQCSNCGHSNNPSTKFCEECGQALGNIISNQNFENQASTETGSLTKRTYSGRAGRLNGAATTVMKLFRAEDLETQIFEHPGEIIVQGRKPPSWYKKVLGLDIAASVKIYSEGNDLITEIGGATWMDKAAGVGIGLFVFWPTLLTAGWGTYMQNVLFKKIDEALKTYLEY
ncbi:MAG: zinc ribbon domain-containing protein [Candidatus Cloacimonetes bacterium]|nr:zinc ribbon domain-containing protein [Candidatus Cloacimonadota bacterium]